MNALYVQTALLMAGAYFLGAILACLLRKFFASDDRELRRRLLSKSTRKDAVVETAAVTTAGLATTARMAQTAPEAVVTTEETVTIRHIEPAVEPLVEPAVQRVPLTTSEISKPGRSLAGEIASSERVSRFERSLGGDEPAAGTESDRVYETGDQETATTSQAIEATHSDTAHSDTGVSTTAVAATVAAAAVAAVAVGAREEVSTEFEAVEAALETSETSVPNIDVPNIDVPNIDVPNVDVATVDPVDVTSNYVEAAREQVAENASVETIAQTKSGGISASTVVKTAIVGAAGTAVAGIAGAAVNTARDSKEARGSQDDSHDNSLDKTNLTTSVDAHHEIEPVAPVLAPIVAAAASTDVGAADDDLKNIDNIDADIEDQLKDAGVTSYSQIAAWSSDDVAEVQDHFGFEGRVQQENWIEQAQILAGGGQTIYSRSRAYEPAPAVVETPDLAVLESTAAAPNLGTASEVEAAGSSAEHWAAQQSDAAADNSIDAETTTSQTGTTTIATGIAATAAAAAATVVSQNDDVPAAKPEPVPEPVAASERETNPSNTSTVVAATSGIAAAAAAAAMAASQHKNTVATHQNSSVGETDAEAVIVNVPVEPTVVAKTVTDQSKIGMTAVASSGIASAAAAAIAATQHRGSSTKQPVEANIKSTTETDASIDTITDGLLETTKSIETGDVAEAADTGVGAGTIVSGIAAAAAAAAVGASSKSDNAGSSAGSTADVAATKLEQLGETITQGATTATPTSSFGGMRSVKSEAYGSGSDASAPVGERVVSNHVDDLKRIRGVGVLLERRLNALGVTQYAQMANWSATDVEKVSQALDFKGRIERENWIEQSRILASGGYTEFSSRVDRGEVDTSKSRG